jgi:3',5'-cyclic AMP phosphodiesterase CpdA
MRPVIDPRSGDAEDDSSSTKRRSLLSLAGSLLGEISLPKLVVAWMLLLVFPALILGLAPMVVSAWVSTVWGKVTSSLGGIWPLLLLAAVIALGWLGGGALYRLVESSFWSLNSLAVEPTYTICREGLRHLAERLLPSRATKVRLTALRAAAAAAGLIVSGLAVLALVHAWPSSRWVGDVSDLASPHRLARVALANSTIIIAAYLAVAALIWAIADTTMTQPSDVDGFRARPNEGRTWRIAHLSDIHVVGERYGFRIESGRSGPRGNERLRQALVQLDEICEKDPLDAILITGDVTDAGRSAEWAEFLDAVTSHPRLVERLLVIPGNHDLNVVDRANPARLDLPTSPARRLRQMRTLSAIGALQGRRVRVVDRAAGRLGESLSEAMEPYRAEMWAFADSRRRRLSKTLKKLWVNVFPMVMPPEQDDGLGIILLNSNADTHFSFTNALGMIPAEQIRGIEITTAQYPRACWVVALHHHPVECPRAAKTLSERIGTALINGNWFIRHLRPLAGRAVLMHGHRHVDWIGECARILIVSAPSPVMEATDDLTTYFYIQTLAVGADGQLNLLPPERVIVGGQPDADQGNRNDCNPELQAVESA